MGRYTYMGICGILEQSGPSTSFSDRTRSKPLSSGPSRSAPRARRRSPAAWRWHPLQCGPSGTLGGDRAAKGSPKGGGVVNSGVPPPIQRFLAPLGRPDFHSLGVAEGRTWNQKPHFERSTWMALRDLHRGRFWKGRSAIHFHGPIMLVG